MLNRIIIFIITLLVNLPAFPQQYSFTSYSIEQGLSQSVVNCMYQDTQGYLWLGTQNGLNKFNGYTFETYNFDPADTSSISNGWVYSIDEDQEGNLWIGTKSGLNQFIRGKNIFRRIRYPSQYPHVVSEYVYDAIVSRSGKIYINTPPVLTIFNPQGNEVTHYVYDLEYDGAVKDNKIPLLEDSKGLVWIGSTRGLSCFDPVAKSFRYYCNNRNDKASLSENSITALAEDKAGRIWIGTPNGLNVFDKTTRKFRSFLHDPRNPASLSNNFIRSVTEEAPGLMWIGTEGGGLNQLCLLAGGGASFRSYTSKDNNLSHDIVLSLLIDRSDNLWIGTLQGVSKTDLKKQKFHLYSRNDSPYSVDLLGNVIASIFKDDNGYLWIGNWGQGLNIFDRASGHVRHYSTSITGNHHLTNDFVHVIFRDSERRIWIGTRDGIFIYDREGDRFTRWNEFFHADYLPLFTGIRICMIIEDHTGNYWIGTQNGLYKVNLANKEVEHFSEEAPAARKISSNMVYCLLEDRDGLIWIATLNGLDVFHPAANRITHYRKIEGNSNSLCDNFVIALCEDHEGSIWIGTSSYVDKFDKKDSAFHYYSRENGLPNNRIFEILEDNRKNLWFATGRGLARFDSATGSFRTYTVEEGLQGLEFNLRASHKSKDGEVFFGGMNGFNSFYPDSLTDNPFIPPVVFTSVYKVRGGIKEPLDIDNTDHITLNYSENTFTIEFAALEFTNPGNNRYSYRMEGVSPEWTDLGNRRFVPFTNLPAGEYLFTVRGSNNDGKWNETGTSLGIVVRPPWWKSWPAYFLYLLIIVLLTFGYIKWRERNHVRQRKLLEVKVEERTLRIELQNKEILSKNEELNALNNQLQQLNATKDKFFSIIAHDLRSPFTSILGFSDLLLSDFRNYDQEKIEKYLSHIKDASRQTFELLQNLLFWARSQTGTMEFRPVVFNLRERIQENVILVEPEAAKKNIVIKAEAAEGSTVFGDPNMIDTVLRNLLTNAIKFTHRGGLIEITARENAEHFHISVRDNGVGMTEENLSRIFRIESKFTTKGTEKERGTGLGLVLCKEFIDKHGSEIRVISVPGKGSEFSFSLRKGPLPET